MWLGLLSTAVLLCLAETTDTDIDIEPSLLIRPIHRVKDISYAEFLKSWSQHPVPLVIEGSTDVYSEEDWTRENLAKVRGFLKGYYIC